MHLSEYLWFTNFVGIGCGSELDILCLFKTVPPQVMLNTKIFADMVINRANLTTIRISALDEGKMATFLLKCARNECDK